MKRPKSKNVYEATVRNKHPFEVNARSDWPERSCFYNDSGNAIPYPETLQSYVFPLVKSAGLGEYGLKYEREYIVSHKKYGLLTYPILHGLKNLVQLMGDESMLRWNNYLSFGAHYIIKRSDDFELFHASVIYDDGAYGDIKFKVRSFHGVILDYRYGWQCFDNSGYAYDLDYDAMDAVLAIFYLLENIKTYYRPSSVFFDVDSYMRIPRELRPRGSFQIPLLPGASCVASRKVRQLLVQMLWLCATYEAKQESLSKRTR